MSTTSYGIEAIWEGLESLVDRFDKFALVIGETVAGTFSNIKGEGAIRAADTPPTCPVLERRRRRILASTLAAPDAAPKRALILTSF